MKIFKLLLTITIAIITVTTFKSVPAIAADKVTFSVPILGEFYISIRDLETYAKSGKITPSLSFYTKFLDQKTLQQFREIIQTSLVDDPIIVYRLTNTAVGEDILKRFGELIYTHPERNGIYAIRAAMIAASAEPEGLTAINFLRHFPTEKVQLNTAMIFSLVKEMKSLFEYKDATIKEIALASQQEIALSKNFSNSKLKSLDELSQLGNYKVRSEKTAFNINNLSQNSQDFNNNYDLKVEIYYPTKLEKTAPLIIIAHGFEAKASDYKELAEHLASYGYIVALPEHQASEGAISTELIEFYSRPKEITYLLDRLEQHLDWQNKIDWSQVGIIGHSLGGATALSVSGAPLDWNRIQNTCQQDNSIFNISIFLQCSAKSLPPKEYSFRDPRIKAVIALNPIGSVVLGRENSSKIKIPTLIVGGTQDFIAPFVDEQLHLFFWLNTPHKYLATVVGGGHVANSNQNNSTEIKEEVFPSSGSSLYQDYLKALNLAFFETHIRERSEYQPYLTANYAESISEPKLPLHLIRFLTPEILDLIYDETISVKDIYGVTATN